MPTQDRFWFEWGSSALADVLKLGISRRSIGDAEDFWQKQRCDFNLRIRNPAKDGLCFLSVTCELPPQAKTGLEVATCEHSSQSLAVMHTAIHDLVPQCLVHALGHVHCRSRYPTRSQRTPGCVPSLRRRPGVSCLCRCVDASQPRTNPRYNPPGATGCSRPRVNVSRLPGNQLISLHLPRRPK